MNINKPFKNTGLQTKLYRIDGQAELTWVVLHTEIGFLHRKLTPDTITHPNTNRARRTVTSLAERRAGPKKRASATDLYV